MTSEPKIICEKCGEHLATVESEHAIQLTIKGMLSVVGIDFNGKVSGSLTCLGCGYTRMYNPVDYHSVARLTPMIFEKGETFTSNRAMRLED